MWVRGLKHRLQHRRRCGCRVAPYVGWWIEIVVTQSINRGYSSRALCGCVD